jgi:DNA processing protein
MARGIDSISQKSCLEAGGRTFAVLGSGVDVCYPGELTGLYHDIQNHGGLISTYAPGMPPVAGNFPPRNRIISGLADAVLLVEARRKSGTLITVDMALEQGREVAVVPGRITDSLSQGCHDLIKQGATVIVEVEQLLELLDHSHKLQSLAQNFSQKETDVWHKRNGDGIDINSRQELEAGLKGIFEVLDRDPTEPEILFTRWKEQGNDGSFQIFMEGLMDLELLDLCKSEKNRFSIR